MDTMSTKQHVANWFRTWNVYCNSGLTSYNHFQLNFLDWKSVIIFKIDAHRSFPLRENYFIEKDRTNKGYWTPGLLLHNSSFLVLLHITDWRTEKLLVTIVNDSLELLMIVTCLINKDCRLWNLSEQYISVSVTNLMSLISFKIAFSNKESIFEECWCKWWNHIQTSFMKIESPFIW